MNRVKLSGKIFLAYLQETGQMDKAIKPFIRLVSETSEENQFEKVVIEEGKTEKEVEVAVESGSDQMVNAEMVVDPATEVDQIHIVHSFSEARHQSLESDADEGGISSKSDKASAQSDNDDSDGPD